MGRTGRFRRQRQQLAASQEQLPDNNFLPELYKHLNSLGWKNETKLLARNFPSTGRGLCSRIAIEEGSELIRLPSAALISIETLENDMEFKQLFDKERFHKDHKIPFQALMAFYILHQLASVQNSKHKAYLHTLPQNFSTPYFCPLAELQFLPENILERTVQQNRLIRQSYASLKLLINSEDFESFYPLQKFRWAYFVVNTRSVYVFGKLLKPKEMFFQHLIAEDCNLALAPLLDLFNHSDQVQTQADLMRNTATKQLDFVLTLQKLERRPCQARHRQLFISYGALTNFKLFSEYGFFLPSNCHDYFEFSLNDIENFLQLARSVKGRLIHSNKFKFIRDHNLNDQMFVHSSDGISHNLHVVLHLLFKEESHFPNILSQVAFGAADHLENITNEAQLLLEFKLQEYRGFVMSLESLATLSKSGQIAKSYLLECIAYLERCMQLL